MVLYVQDRLHTVWLLYTLLRFSSKTSSDRHIEISIYTTTAEKAKTYSTGQNRTDTGPVSRVILWKSRCF